MDEHESQFPCFVPGCRQLFRSEGGWKQHAKAKHSNVLNAATPFDLCEQLYECVFFARLTGVFYSRLPDSGITLMNAMSCITIINAFCAWTHAIRKRELLSTSR